MMNMNFYSQRTIWHLYGVYLKRPFSVNLVMKCNLISFMFLNHFFSNQLKFVQILILSIRITSGKVALYKLEEIYEHIALNLTTVQDVCLNEFLASSLQAESK